MRSKALQMARIVLSAITNPAKKQNFNSLILAPLTVVSAEDNGNCHFQWQVDELHLDQNGLFHAGCVVGIMDLAKGISTMVLKDGVICSSVEIDLSYMKTAEKGDLLDIHTYVTKKGKRLAFTSAIMKNNKGEIVAKASQTGSVVMGTKDHFDKEYGVET